MGPRLAWIAVLCVGMVACSSNGSAGAEDAAAHDAAADGGADATADDAAPDAPLLTTCTGDPSACLWGRVLAPTYDQSVGLTAKLYRSMPYGTLPAIATHGTAGDGSFAFSGLDPLDHYYILVSAIGTARQAFGIKGPFKVPNTEGELTLTVDPFAIAEVYEDAAPGAATALTWISGRVFDGTGTFLTDASFTFEHGGVETACPYQPNRFGFSSYWYFFPSGVASADTYGLAATGGGLGATTVTGTLTRRLPPADPTLTAPTEGATVALGTGLDATWPDQPGYDYVVVIVRDATATSIWSSPAARLPEAGTETIPASAFPSAGAYTVAVQFSTANCVGSGCAYVGILVERGVTVQ
jgi:hypothetical protein